MAETVKDPRIISSLQRALDILSLFGPQTPELGITDIAKALNLAQEHCLWARVHLRAQRIYRSES